MKRIIIISCLFAVAFAASIEVQDDEPESVELPEDAIVCDRNSPTRDECIKESVQKMLPLLHKGLSNLNIPPLDPFDVQNTHLEYKRDNLYGSLYIKNAKVYGLSRGIVNKVRTNIEENGMQSEWNISLPRMFIEGTYKGEGRFNNFKMTSRGYFNVTMKDVNMLYKTSGHYEDKSNDVYLQIDEIDVLPTKIGDMKVYASGLFPDPEMNRIVLEFVNQYWPIMYQVMLPETKEQWEPIVLSAMNKFLGRVPLRKMLPDGASDE